MNGCGFHWKTLLQVRWLRLLNRAKILVQFTNARNFNVTVHTKWIFGICLPTAHNTKLLLSSFGDVYHIDLSGYLAEMQIAY